MSDIVFDDMIEDDPSDTPRIDAEAYMAGETWEPKDEVVDADFARQLERELNAAKAALSGRTVSCSNCNALARENAAMREAIKEAHESLTALDECRIFYADSMDIANYTTDDCATARTKLQPFLK